MEAALRFYEKVEQFPKSSVYPYAAYKKGWCYVNLGDYKTALETFVGVVRLTQTAKLAVDRTAAGAAGEGGEEGRRQGVRPRRRRRQGAAVLREGGRRLRAEDDGAARRALLGGGQGAGIDARLQADHRRQHGEPARLRVAEQGAAQFAVAAELRQGAGDAGAGSGWARVCSRQGRAPDASKPEQAAECRERVPRRRARAGADLAPRGAEDAGHGRPSSSPSARTVCSWRSFADDKQAYEMRFYRGELLWALRRWKDAAEQYTEVVASQPGRQVHARRGVRGGAGLEERARRRRRAVAPAAIRSARRQRAGRGRGVRQARAAPDPRQPAEDDRRVSHLREAGARRARAAR